MSHSQEEVELTRDVNATLIPHGEEFTLGSGEKVTITHRLGGNFTVMTLQGMYRIAAKDADALGESVAENSAKPIKDNSKPVSTDEIRENLRTVFDPEIPVNVVDLGLIYRIEIEETKDRGRIARHCATRRPPYRIPTAPSRCSATERTAGSSQSGP